MSDSWESQLKQLGGHIKMVQLVAQEQHFAIVDREALFVRCKMAVNAIIKMALAAIR